MREGFSSLLTQIRKIWLNRKLVFPVAIAVSLLGWFVVASLPNVFEGNATLYVDTKSMLGRVLDRVAVNTEELDAEFVALARQRLLSRPNIERLVRETDLDIDAQTPEQMDQLLDKVAKTVNIESMSTSSADRSRPNIFMLTVRHEDPAIAKKMIESLVEIFGESVVGQNREGSDQTEQFLKEQIASYQRKLDETEARLTEFRQLNVGSMPGEDNIVYSDLKTSRGTLDDTRREVARVSAQQAALRAQLGATVGAARQSASSETLRKADQWSKLNAQLESLLSQYTDQHPQVVALRKRIEDLNFDPATAGLTVPSARTLGDASALQMELFRTDGELSALRAKERDYALRVATLERSLNSIPGADAQYQALTRDYDIIKQQYNALVQRRESARLSREAELTTNQVQFQVIEPPHVGTLPVEPRRGLLLSAVLLAALALAGATGFVLSQVSPTFGDLHELELGTGLSVYGSVGVVRNARDTRTHRIEYLLYIAAFLALILIYVGLVVWLADDFKALLSLGKGS